MTSAILGAGGTVMCKTKRNWLFDSTLRQKIKPHTHVYIHIYIFQHICVCICVY